MRDIATHPAFKHVQFAPRTIGVMGSERHEKCVVVIAGIYFRNHCLNQAVVSIITTSIFIIWLGRGERKNDCARNFTAMDTLTGSILAQAWSSGRVVFFVCFAQ